MGWPEFAALGVSAALALAAAGALRVRSTDPKAAHLWFGLSREENGRFGTVVGAVGLVVVGAMEPGFFARYPVVALGWGILIVLCAYRGWIRKGPRHRSGDAPRR